MKLDPKKTGLAIGCFAALMHLFWVVAVALGFAQTYMDWVISLHFINNPFTVLPFNLVSALILLIVALVKGFLIGWVFATVWNWSQKYKI